MYLLLREHNEPLLNAIRDEESHVLTTDLAEQHRLNAPRPIRNHFAKGFPSDDTKAALSVTISPDRSKLAFVQATDLYSLLDFLPMLKDYVTRCSPNNDPVRILEV
ncbi:hypothetical protein PAXRUDRAFT_827261 [Paxillus rubicundulus Ve08.2h10]|uniref:Uncharacterized protein n=1 Tax=Paxillus rubicundulus Ve08.2h10 TaxID=930991 RepID=A0A0D0E8T0_9AGAM|nr:hypothetical protein PAXRUDRAFT_827261 [Paxillus rubicundulus Ve08.2h10]